MLLKSFLLSLPLAFNLFFDTLPLNSKSPFNPIASFDCTLSFRCYIVTEAGIVGVSLSISAPDCETAQKGVWEAVKGFAKGI
jgi:hypothetical protein